MNTRLEVSPQVSPEHKEEARDAEAERPHTAPVVRIRKSIFTSGIANCRNTCFILYNKHSLLYATCERKVGNLREN